MISRAQPSRHCCIVPAVTTATPATPARERLLDAGIELFAELPPAALFGGLSVSALARRGRTTRATFYHHWPTLDAVLHRSGRSRLRPVRTVAARPRSAPAELPRSGHQPHLRPAGRGRWRARRGGVQPDLRDAPHPGGERGRPRHRADPAFVPPRPRRGGGRGHSLLVGSVAPGPAGPLHLCVHRRRLDRADRRLGHAPACRPRLRGRSALRRDRRRPAAGDLTRPRRAGRPRAVGRHHRSVPDHIDCSRRPHDREHDPPATGRAGRQGAARRLPPPRGASLDRDQRA